MAEYRLERLNDENADKWEGFNNHSVEGSLFHGLRWKEIVEKDPGITSQYFLLYKNDDVVGLFPFVEHNVRFFRGLAPASRPQRLNAVLEEPADPLAMDFVIKELRKFRSDEKRISFVCLSTVHQEALTTISTHPALPVDNSLGDMVLDFSESSPDLIWNALTSNRRKKIRRFDKDGFTITDACSEDALQLFYKYYHDNVRHIGGIPQPFSHFSDLCDSMADEIRITILSKGSLVAGGLFQFRDMPRRTAHGTYVSLNRDLSNKYSPSHYLWWEAVNWAWENDFEKFSFGAQHLDAGNPRFQVKYNLGARFKPMYLKMIPLTTIFSLGTTGVKHLVRWKANHQHSVSESGELPSPYPVHAPDSPGAISPWRGPDPL